MAFSFFLFLSRFFFWPLKSGECKFVFRSFIQFRMSWVIFTIIGASLLVHSHDQVLVTHGDLPLKSDFLHFKTIFDTLIEGFEVN